MTEPGRTEDRPNGSHGASMIRALVGVSALCGVLIVLAFQWTLPVIKAKKAEALRRAVFHVIPSATKVVTFRETDDGSLVVLEGEDGQGAKYYAGYDDRNRLAGVALEAHGQGYQDVIKVIYGYAPREESIVGMKVLESKETPGLGDKIGKDPSFLANFKDLDVSLTDDGTRPRHAIEVVKKGAKRERWQIDAITGATISSKAIGRLIGKSVADRIPRVVSNLARLEEGK